MHFVLSDTEILSAIQGATRNDDGYFIVHIPADRLQSAEQSACLPILVFSALTHAVSCGKLSTRLSPTQFTLLRYVYDHGRVGFEELQDEVWSKPAGDGAIRGSISKLNSRLLDCGFSFELVAHHSRVSIEKIG